MWKILYFCNSLKSILWYIFKGCWRFQLNLKSGFQFSLLKNGEISWSREKTEISNLIGWFCLKHELLEGKLTQQFPLLTLKGSLKFQQNLNYGFHFSLSKNGEIYLLEETNQWNFKFWPSHSLKEILWFFWQAELETRVQILLKLSTALHSQDRKLLCYFFAEAIYLLDKTIQRHLKFQPSRPLKEILPFFGRLNWKSRFRFCWNFPRLITVRRGNCCASFLPKKFIF